MTDPKRIEKGLFWDRAWGLAHGCRPRSEACAHCWSVRESMARQNHPNTNIAKRHANILDVKTRHFNGRVNLQWDLLDLPHYTRKSKSWAVWDDLFYGDDEDRQWCERHGIEFLPVTEQFIIGALDTMIACPQHQFFVLTKRAKRMREIVTHYCNTFGLDNLPANIVGMVTAENQGWADARIPELLSTPYTTRGVIIEPMLGPVDLSHFPLGKPQPISTSPHGGAWYWCKDCGRWNNQKPTTILGRCGNCGSWNWVRRLDRRLDLVIAGGESGTGARPTHPDNFRALRDECVKYGVKFFFKSWGEWAPFDCGYDVCKDERYKTGKMPQLFVPLGGEAFSVPLTYMQKEQYPPADAMNRVGKRRSGRILDGRTWDELPEAGQ